ncbi:MarR family winged helix-turn-helix transcriptional regulator [Pendulispora rubella]|uniref:MarR family winged helix-turn-helix transcriptional regulator n=1 Tax=Pendulispora rubella TaxID=2741070 RepID=A0ABZ2KXJ4_9BACT
MDRRLFFLLPRAARMVMARANDATIRVLGVSSAQLATLAYLAKKPGSTMTDVANLFDLNKSGVSGMVARLERAGLVKREPSPRDGRATLLWLTPKGESVRAESMPLVRRATAEMTEGFTPEEVDVIYRFLNAIIDKCADAEEEP